MIERKNDVRRNKKIIGAEKKNFIVKIKQKKENWKTKKNGKKQLQFEHKGESYFWSVFPLFCHRDLPENGKISYFPKRSNKHCNFVGFRCDTIVTNLPFSLCLLRPNIYSIVLICSIYLTTDETSFGWMNNTVITLWFSGSERGGYMPMCKVCVCVCDISIENDGQITSRVWEWVGTKRKSNQNANNRIENRQHCQQK